MPLSTHIKDGTGTKSTVKVSMNGQLITAPYSYDEVKYVNLDIAAQGYTFFSPKAGKQFVLTGITMTANKSVGTDCIVDVYEATLENSATITTSIFQFEILKNGRRELIGLNILVSEGVFLNAKTDDDDVFATLMGYYIPTVS